MKNIMLLVCFFTLFKLTLAAIPPPHETHLLPHLSEEETCAELIEQISPYTRNIPHEHLPEILANVGEVTTIPEERMRQIPPEVKIDNFFTRADFFQLIVMDSQGFFHYRKDVRFTIYSSGDEYVFVSERESGSRYAQVFRKNTACGIWEIFPK